MELMQYDIDGIRIYSFTENSKIKQINSYIIDICRRTAVRAESGRHQAAAARDHTSQEGEESAVEGD